MNPKSLVFLSILALTSAAQAQEDEGEPSPEETRALCPYFFVAGGNPEVDRLPLKSLSADLRITGPIAAVKVKQVFENHAATPIEAVYVFPASTRAAVHGVRMRIGNRVVEAKIERKKKAREDYEAAKKEGKRASLLEQNRPNVFSMSVANIMPGDRIAVELDYSEMLVPEDGTYEIVYPAVVGPRYPGRVDRNKDGWIATGHLGQGEKETYEYSVTAHIHAGMPVQSVTSPSHELLVTDSDGDADIHLKNAGGGNKDFILRYRLAGGEVKTGLLLSPRTAGDRHFALLMQPPARPEPSDIPPREYVFLLDVSGSMFGFPLDTTKALMRDLAQGLRPTDLINVVLFAGASQTLWPQSQPATPANVQAMLKLISRQKGGGGTELMGGLKMAYEVPRATTAFSRSVVVVTDGFVGVEAEAFGFVRSHLSQANLFAFGIGSSVNRALMEGLARAGLGEPFIVTRPEVATEVAERFRKYIDSPVLTGVKVAFKGFDASDVLPTAVPDLMSNRPLLIFGKYRGQPTGDIIVTGRNGTGAWRRTIKVSSKDITPDGAVLSKLWARKKAEAIEDELNIASSDGLTEELAQLGLGYSLLTRETSFIAIDHIVANTTGDLATSDQPLPLPEGVSNSALGGSVEVSRSSMPPGDPILTVNVPKDARTVTAFFPFGLVKDLVYDPMREAWQTRFLVPKTVADGDYQVPVVVVLADGSVQNLVAHYRIDSQSPDFETHLVPVADGVRIQVVAKEPLREVVVAEQGRPAVRVYLERSQDGLAFTGQLTLPSGKHLLRVVATDEARNEADELVSLEVP